MNAPLALIRPSLVHLLTTPQVLKGHGPHFSIPRWETVGAPDDDVVYRTAKISRPLPSSTKVYSFQLNCNIVFLLESIAFS